METVGSDASIDFNPRTREGCDYNTCLSKLDRIAISIHAPARGATFGF